MGLPKTHTLEYIAANKEVPFGGLTSTARLGRNWFDKLQPGDLLILTETESKKVFGQGVVVAVDLTDFEDIISNVELNHTGQRELPEGHSPAATLAYELVQAYGEKVKSDVWTVVHFIRVNE